MFDANYIKANDPLTKRALWIREQKIGSRIWRWAVLTDPAWEAPRVWTPDVDLTRTLIWDDPGAPQKLLPRWMYWLPVPTKYESPHWNGRLSGELIVDDIRWNLTHWPAQQGHLWGWRVSQEWAWAHGNCFVEDHTASFEILTSGGRTVLALQSQQFNYIAHSTSTWRCTRHEITATHWRWEFANGDLKMAGNFQLGYAEIVKMTYPTPQGESRRCHNTKVGCGTIVGVRGTTPVLQLTAHDSLAWEFVRTDASGHL